MKKYLKPGGGAVLERVGSGNSAVGGGAGHHQIINNNSGNNAAEESTRTTNSLSSFIGKTYKLGGKSNVVTVEEVIAEGGFGVVYLVKNNADKKHYALKRIVVNNDEDLNAADREIKIMVSPGGFSTNLLFIIYNFVARVCENYNSSVAMGII
jgi:hypothetical protein